MITNREGNAVSLQIGTMGNIMGNNFTLPNGVYFLVKNITEENITANVKLANSDVMVSTVIYPGWNVELVKEISGYSDNSLQFGY